MQEDSIEPMRGAGFDAIDKIGIMTSFSITYLQITCPIDA